MTTNQHMSGRPVISIETGERLGTIDQIVLEPDGRTIAAFTVQSATGGGILSPEQPTASWLLAEDIHAVGPDAITINTPDLLKETIERRDYLLAGDLVHRKVMTEGGAMLGEVASIHFDQQSLQATGLEISKGFFKTNPIIGIDHVKNVGNELIMVDDNTGIEGTEDQAASETSPSEEDEQAVVGDVTAGDQPGTFQVRKILDGEETTPAQ
jgi:uncharacterized protein YrrD